LADSFGSASTLAGTFVATVHGIKFAKNAGTAIGGLLTGTGAGSGKPKILYNAPLYKIT
jgi:hypothetical protein